MPLNKWFNVYAIFPIKDHFVTLFMGFTKIVEEQKEQIELFSALNDVIFPGLAYRCLNDPRWQR